MFDQAKFDAVKAEIDSGIDIAATVAAGVAPEYLPFIVLGKAVAKALPDLYADVARLIDKTEPTDTDTASLATKISQLEHPETT